MSKETQAKAAEKAAPNRQVQSPSPSEAGPEWITELPYPVGLNELPPAMRPRQVKQMQQVQGNRVVQRSLERMVIQRAPGGGGGAAPIPTLATHEARTAFAIDVLKKAYGGKIKAETKVNAVSNEGALRAEYDRSMIAQGKKFREKDSEGNETLRDWQSGDTLKHPDMKKEFAGFRDTSNNQIYVDTSKPPDEQTATIAHEMLHASSSGAIVNAFGKGLDEGITEKLTIDAFAKAGFSANSGMYQEWVVFATRLGAAFGMDALINAYFGGLEPLREAINERLGKGSWKKFSEAMKNGDMAAVNEMITKGKVAVVQSLLSGWVSDEDIEAIKEIYQTALDFEKAEMRPIIQAGISDLWSIGQRTALRVLLAGK